MVVEALAYAASFEGVSNPRVKRSFVKTGDLSQPVHQ